MNRWMLIALVWGCCGLVPQMATADGRGPPQPRSQVLSASSTLSGGTSGPLFEVPDYGRFLLTQVCISGSAQRIEGDTFGDIAYASLVAGCTSFTPGIALPPGDMLSHINEQPLGSAPRSAMITGVLTAKRGRWGD